MALERVEGPQDPLHFPRINRRPRLEWSVDPSPSLEELALRQRSSQIPMHTSLNTVPLSSYLWKARRLSKAGHWLVLPVILSLTSDRRR